MLPQVSEHQMKEKARKDPTHRPAPTPRASQGPQRCRHPGFRLCPPELWQKTVLFPEETMLVAQSCPILFDRMDCSPPGSSVHGHSPGKSTGVGCHLPSPIIYDCKYGYMTFGASHLCVCTLVNSFSLSLGRPSTLRP